MAQSAAPGHPAGAEAPLSEDVTCDPSPCAVCSAARRLDRRRHGAGRGAAVRHPRARAVRDAGRARAVGGRNNRPYDGHLRRSRLLPGTAARTQRRVGLDGDRAGQRHPSHEKRPRALPLREEISSFRGRLLRRCRWGCDRKRRRTDGMDARRGQARRRSQIAAWSRRLDASPEAASRWSARLPPETQPAGA